LGFFAGAVFHGQVGGGSGDTRAALTRHLMDEEALVRRTVSATTRSPLEWTRESRQRRWRSVVSDVNLEWNGQGKAWKGGTE